MVAHRAALSRDAALARLSAGPLLAGLALPQQGVADHGGGGGGSPDLLIFPHPQGRLSPDMSSQNPMFSRPKRCFGPCGPLPPSYMSLNHRNIADV
ncbi:hypothetical protein AB7M17_001665 [Bradyrhizobium sp. USDA 377]